MYVVTVVFGIKKDRLDDFMPLIMAQAENSLTKEEGCVQFDVSVDPDNPAAIFLYEIYRSAEDFAAHKETDHYKDFNSRAGDMVAAKTVKTYERKTA